MVCGELWGSTGGVWEGVALAAPAGWAQLLRSCFPQTWEADGQHAHTCEGSSGASEGTYLWKCGFSGDLKEVPSSLPEEGSVLLVRIAKVLVQGGG